MEQDFIEKLNEHMEAEKQGSPVVNNYYFGKSNEGLRGDKGIFSAAGERGVRLNHCKAYRVWVNATGATQNRTANVHPTGALFNNGSIVTVFVADANYRDVQDTARADSGPPQGSNPTTVRPEGDSVGKSVPDGKAIFAHYDRNTNLITSDNATISSSA